MNERELRKRAGSSSSMAVGVCVCVLSAGCSSAPASSPAPAPAQTPTGPDDLPLPLDGFQLRSAGADILPGEDVEYCEIAELPGDPSETYYVRSVELANAAYSHHLVVSTAIPGSAADAALRSLNVGDRVRCNGADYEWPEGGLVGLLSAQTPYIARTFPDGVGTVLHGNQRVVFDYHYVNSNTEPIRAQSAFNVHVIDRASIRHIATAFSFFNFTIDVPARSSKAFTAECHFQDDLTLAGLVRHTHEQGRDFTVWFSGGAEDGQHVWTSHDWKHEPGFDFEQPIVMKAGGGFRFRCDFENPNDRRLRYGIRGSDEMCILAGWIWPAGEAHELRPQDCGITWIDAEGIGHPASESGGFPPAAEQDALMCRAAIAITGLGALDTNGCADCLCGSCAGVLLGCAGDPDCSALLACIGQGCASESECIQNCESELHEHSSAIGMMQQVRACVTSRCSACAPNGG